MTEQKHPGVFIEEIGRGPRPIEGVSTNTAAILGEAERGSIAPRLVTSFAEYVRWFGAEFADTKFLPYAVRGFFDNGGRRAFICRLVGAAAATAEATFGDFSVRAAGPGAWGSRVFARIDPGTARNADGSSKGFRLRLAYWRGQPGTDPFIAGAPGPPPDIIEDFDDLVSDEASPDFYGKRVNFVDRDKGDTNQGADLSVLAMLVRHTGVTPATRPADGAALLTGGADDV
ncbi:MAG TPA: hypothetical protein VF491_14525, partial [Vicinamibacterales bacterium]